MVNNTSPSACGNVWSRYSSQHQVAGRLGPPSTHCPLTKRLGLTLTVPVTDIKGRSDEEICPLIFFVQS